MATNYIWSKYKIKPNIIIGTEKTDIGEIYRDVSDTNDRNKRRIVYYNQYRSLKIAEGGNYLVGEGDPIGETSYGSDFPINPSNYFIGLKIYTNLEYYSYQDNNSGHYRYTGYYGYPVSLNTSAPCRKGDYLERVLSQNRYAYPDNGKQNGYWYVYVGTDNRAPTISGNNLDLGSKTDDFSIEYIVSDADNDTCTVDIFVDNVKKISGQRVNLNTKYNYQIKMGDFTLGKHNIRITASDSKGASATRTYTFTKSNTAPTISGSDEDLGGKSTAFTENYRVSDKNNDDVAVTITLDDLEIGNLSSAQNKDLSFTITDDQLLAMEIGSTHIVTIKADDGKGGVAYRRYTFTKINRPPIMSGSDADLGQKKTEFTQSFSFTDVENDKIYCRVYLDGRTVYENLEVVDSKTYSYRIPHEEFIQLRYGKHEIKIEAWDDYSVDKKQYRVYSFERISNGLEVEVKINEFTVQPKKIIAVPHGIFASDAIMKVYACNNYMDTNPTWEDISAESKAARAHAFTNTSKSGSKWSIGIKVIVENGQSGVSSVLRGIKGGYE